MIELPAPDSPRASIIVVVSSADAGLARCLEQLAGLASAISFETIVVLNGLAPAEASSVRDGVRGVKFVESEINLGFAGALNHGRAVARGELIVSLHDDAEVHVGWLDALVETADRDRGAGAVGSLVLREDGRVRAAGWELMPDGRTRPLGEGRPPGAKEFDEPRAVDYASSCSLLVRAASWDRIGGADERLYPVYYVDVDLCLAIRACGERVLVQPRSVVVHPGGASTERDFAHFVVERNRRLMIEKWGDLISAHAPGSGATFAADGARPAQATALDRAGRIRRDSVLADAYAADLRSRLAAQAAEIDELRRQAADREGIVAELESAVRRDTTETALLRERAALLTQIQQGGWWRLRGRLLPLLRAATAFRALRNTRRR